MYNCDLVTKHFNNYSANDSFENNRQNGDQIRVEVSIKTQLMSFTYKTYLQDTCVKTQSRSHIKRPLSPNKVDWNVFHTLCCVRTEQPSLDGLNTCNVTELS